jgi:DNA-binding transcriptional ArsR family regulator
MVWTMINSKITGSLENQADEQAKYCSIFSNSRRVQILWALADSEMSVGEIAEAVGTSLQNISQHLSKMRDYDIVSSRREGQTIFYRIKEGALENQCSGLLRAIDSKLSITTRINE